MRSGRLLGARAAYLGVLAAGFAGLLIANLPGHLTLDSVLELYEGRFRVRQSWAPSFYAWLLGVFDAVWRGTGLYVVASALLLFVAIASLAWLRGRLSRWAVAAAAIFVVSPLVALYQAIVWKDVLFADAAVAAFVCLAWASRKDTGKAPRVALLSSALVLLAAAALLRQNGVVAGMFAAAALAVVESRGRWRRALAWGAGAMVAIVALSHAMNLATQPPPGKADGVKGDGMSQGMRVLQGYDLIGAVTLDPAFPLKAVTSAEPDAAAVLRTLGPRYYSPERTDFTDGQPDIQDALTSIPSAALMTDWRSLILEHPGLYVRERIAVFRWVFLTPRIDRCVPICLGVQATPKSLEALGMRFRWSRQDDRLLRYNKAFTHTPVYSHLAYALIALAVAGLLLRRRDPADVMIIALMGGALAFAASFFLISIACDYRYLYFLDLAAMAGLIYLAADPPGGRKIS